MMNILKADAPPLPQPSADGTTDNGKLLITAIEEESGPGHAARVHGAGAT